MKNKDLAPICLFTYNRLNETKKTVEALKSNFLARYSDLIVYSDGPKNNDTNIKVNEVRDYLYNIDDSFKTIKIICSEYNKGLAQSIIEGVSDVLNEFNKVIVLEDDLITTPNFLDFMNQGLNHFENSSEIYSISGFVPIIKNTNKFDYFLHERSYPWGWATWRNEWFGAIFDKIKIRKYIYHNPEILNKFEEACGDDIRLMLLNSINGINDSWYVRWVFSNFIEKKLSVFPVKSFVTNVGFNSSHGTHCIGLSAYEHHLINETIREFEFEKNAINLQRHFLKYFKTRHKLLFRLRLLFKKNGLELLKYDLINRFFKK